MSNILGEFTKNIISLHRYAKRSIAFITDIGLCILATWLAYVIRLEELVLFVDFNFYSALLSVLIAIPIFWITGLYRTIFRYTSLSIILNIMFSSLVYGLLYFIVIGVYNINGVPRSIGVLQPMILFFGIIGSRLSVKYFLNYNFENKSLIRKKNVLVYGAGDAGRQLVIALENSPEYRVIGFLDDNKSLHRQVLLGLTIFDPNNLQKLIQAKYINLIFLAIPTIGRRKRNEIIENLNKYKLTVKTLPSVSEIVNNKVTLSDIKDLNINDLLNRDEIQPVSTLLNKNINSKTVLVTGAGGSIGSELCRQIAKLKPKKLILLELNEFALYKINEELKFLNQKLKIIPLLVNVQNQKKLETIFETFEVDTIYHAAAYKHVHLVEENICEAVKNNVYCTLAIIKASVLKNILNLVLISSDKAVRPTNIMGASKRLSELCMQGIYNQNKNIKTQFSIVRFGNVLESSGSVIPKFKKQINEGGPITLTHKDVTRYFMTVTEAAQLVIQAGAMGKNCEVFVLDMGESVKISELVKKMIKLSGFTVKDYKNPTGDIGIEIIGLRPGEKLYEELLIGDDPQKTNHPKIYKANDPYIPFEQIEQDLNNLKNLCDNNKVKDVKELLEQILKLYQSNSNIIDHIYNQQLINYEHRKDSSMYKAKNNKVIKIK